MLLEKKEEVDVEVTKETSRGLEEVRTQEKAERKRRKIFEAGRV